MKTKFFCLAASLCSLGLATAQTTTTNSYSSPGTTTDTTYRATTTTTDSTGATNTGTMNTGTMNTGTMNNATGTTYGATTTTTTSTYTPTANATPAKERAWGKEGKFGVYAGVNFSRFVQEPIQDGSYRAGWQAGIYGRTGGTVFGQLGLEYRNSTTNLIRPRSTGTSGTGLPSQSVDNISGQINQHFIAIPAYVGLRIGSALGLRVQAGAELSTLVRNPNNEFGIGSDDFERAMFNGLLGAGINLGPLTLDAVYNRGFSQVFTDADTKRNILMLNLGFRF
ncbi:outer membrane beta-barrel protein [Spirosoma montaniterrae]|uniref:Outer membrane protein beta-barrel domain-containing protein n=1 Tax=Spirosoma montaniterrae TaxID=1178516 RepID=A0A1P9WSC7_9BACT|nr:outer membrane beta-barrel protein [Spirosoma montaniterrae]AQG78281.1 hypothetical protein AWR27_02350 [Spirosoma montaniterrae]